jgi:hypothetical protein
MIKKVDTYFQQKLLEYGNELIRISREELASQGHRVTGETERSFKAELKVIGVYHYELTILVKTSAIILNYGVEAKRVPYTPGKPRGSVSKYIQALLNWAALVKPQLSDKERKSFVFAVAKKASKEGHPTSGSYAFSKNGRRKDWLSFGISMNENLIKTIINPDNIYNILTNSIRA